MGLWTPRALSRQARVILNMSPASNLAFTIRPTSKFVIFSYVLTAVLVLAAVTVWRNQQARIEFLYAILVLATIRLAVTAIGHARIRFTSLAFDGQNLKYQSGVLAKSTRLLNMSKIQDVRVDQSFSERLMGVGTITLETAGETGRLVMENIDRPHGVAQRILSLTQSAGDPPRSGT
jgi:membrane protein YdbS with pleckstrin-like domain